MVWCNRKISILFCLLLCYIRQKLAKNIFQIPGHTLQISGHTPKPDFRSHPPNFRRHWKRKKNDLQRIHFGVIFRAFVRTFGGGRVLFLIVFEHCIQCDIFAPRCSLSHVPVCRVSCFQADMLEPCFPPQSMFARTTLLFPLVRWSMIFILSGNLPVQKKENYMRKLFRLVCQ